VLVPKDLDLHFEILKVVLCLWVLSNYSGYLDNLAKVLNRKHETENRKGKTENKKGEI
jgi:hypothetical protein